MIRFRFGTDGKTESISVEPSDLGLFDHVLNVALKDSEASQIQGLPVGAPYHEELALGHNSFTSVT